MDDAPLPELGAACPYPGWQPPYDIRLTVLPEHPCAYLPGRTAQSRAFWAEELPSEVYHRFMDAGFRRSGKLIYQPICKGCRQCLPIRVVVNDFRPSKSQRRAVRRNSDLSLQVGPLKYTEEKWELYQRYLLDWHHRAPEDSSELESFLYDSPVDTLEFTHRNSAGKLLAVGICDVSDASLSSVYFYFDPGEASRSLGTFGAMCELDFARNLGLPYYYLGYWVDGCSAMVYKTAYRAHEILQPDAVWRTGVADDSASAGRRANLR